MPLRLLNMLKHLYVGIGEQKRFMLIACNMSIAGSIVILTNLLPELDSVPEMRN